MLRNLALAEERRDQTVAHMKLNPLADKLMWYRVKVITVLHVVVDVNFDWLDINVLVRMTRQRRECSLINIFKRRSTVAR